MDFTIFWRMLELNQLKILYLLPLAQFMVIKKFPIKESDSMNPKNFYGLTKKNNEEMAKTYSNLYNMNICGLRFFTIYGEWGRP